MNWIKVLPQSELPEGSWHKAEVGGRSIALVNHRGQIYAMSPACPHMGGPIYKGEITANGTIICPWHHGEFDLCTGEVKAWAPSMGTKAGGRPQDSALAHPLASFPNAGRGRRHFGWA